MVEAVDNLLKQLDRLSIDKIVIEAAKEKEVEIIAMNTEQLYSGIDGEGNRITPLYAQSTIKAKRRKNQPTDRVTLKDKGDFYDSFEVIYREQEIELIARDEKRVYLFRRYGEQVVGLTEENINKLSELLAESIKEKLKKNFGVND